MTPAQLDALWRPSEGFVGPVMPPMLLWFARGRPKDDWQVRAEKMRDSMPSDDLPLFAFAFESEAA